MKTEEEFKNIASNFYLGFLIKQIKEINRSKNPDKKYKEELIKEVIHYLNFIE